MRAMAFSSKIGSDSVRRAIEESRKAVQIAPEFGMAHALLTRSLALQVTDGGQEMDDALAQEIRNHMTRALQLDGESPLVIGALSTGYFALGDPQTALRLAQRSVELDPIFAGSLIMLGVSHMALGQIPDAIAVFERQNSLSSTDVGRYFTLECQAICHTLEGRPDVAEDLLNRSLTLHPDFRNALKWKAIVAAIRGNEKNALATMRRLREVEPAMTIDHHVRQMRVYKGLRDRFSEPIAILRRLWDETEGDG